MNATAVVKQMVAVHFAVALPTHQDQNNVTGATTKVNVWR